MSHKEIIRLAVPAIVSNITTPLLGLADTAITGHIGGAAYIGAIAIGGGMFSLAYWPMNFLRMGTSGLTAQAYGKMGAAAAAPYLILWRSLAVALVLSLAIVVASPLLADALLWFLEPDVATAPLARRYFMIVVLGAPAVLGVYGLSGWFLGMQDSRAPMWMAVVTNVANILISAVLVFGVGMRIAGVAYGTLTAQWIGLGVGVAMAHGRYSAFARLGAMRDWVKSVFDRGQIRRFFTVNVDIFFRTLCLAAVTLWFTRCGAAQGAQVLAANALLMQLFILFSYFMDGFAFAGEALAGKYLGMGDSRGLARVVRGVFEWGAAVAATFTLLYLWGGDNVLGWLTDDRGVVDVAAEYLPWALAVPIAGVAAFAWDGIFIGLTMTRPMLVSMVLAAAAFFGLQWWLVPEWGNHGLWIAFLSYLAVRGLVQTIYYRTRHVG